MTDLQEGYILAAVNVTVMFGGMRLLYGAWPWEYRKTWYATKVPNQILHEIQQKIKPESELDSNVYSDAADIVQLPTTDSFER